MRQFLKATFTILLLSLLTRCSNPEFSDRNVERKAIRITELLDSNTIQTFHIWNYGIRGNNEVWVKIMGDSTEYSCFYRKEKDTASLTIFKSSGFLIDFPSNLYFDTIKYHRFDIDMYGGNIFRITSVDHFGQDHITDTMIFSDRAFKKNPFIHFSALSALKDSLGVYGISYRSDIGNFVTFWLSAQHKLTYLPDDLNLNPKFQEPWLADFTKGKMIKKHWNLRKLEEPRDGG